MPKRNDSAPTVCHPEEAAARTLLLSQPPRPWRQPMILLATDSSTSPFSDSLAAATPCSPELLPCSTSGEYSTIGRSTSCLLSGSPDVNPPINAPPSPTLPSLPLPIPLANPSFVWGPLDAETFIQSVSCAYSEVVHWRKNTFTVPFGNAGKRFVTELSTLYRAYAEGSALECIALKAITVMSILLLQKPHNKSKAKGTLLAWNAAYNPGLTAT